MIVLLVWNNNIPTYADGKTYEELQGIGLVEKQSILTETLGKLRENHGSNHLVLVIDGLDEVSHSL